MPVMDNPDDVKRQYSSDRNLSAGVMPHNRHSTSRARFSDSESDN